MASVNRTGLVEAEPASRKRHVHERPEEGREPGQERRTSARPDRDLTERDDPSEPRLGRRCEQEVDEVAVPLVGDRRSPWPSAGMATAFVPVAREGRAAVDPAAVGELVPAGLEPREAEEQADRQPEQAGRGVAEQEPGEGRSFDLDRLPPGSFRSWNRTTSRTRTRPRSPTARCRGSCPRGLPPTD